MKEYLRLLKEVLENGEDTENRTGIRTRSLFGLMGTYDLREGFPLLTTKQMAWKTIVDELFWFIHAGHNTHDKGAPKKIWDAWADESGELGRIYGVQWRDWKAYERMADGNFEQSAIDQLSLAIALVKYLPNNRRNIVSAWNVGEIIDKQCSFPPCHVMFQLRRFGEHLDMAMYQRSCDMAVGVPFNIASYSLLLLLIAHECKLKARRFIHFMGDAHIYADHIENVKDQLNRTPYPTPQVLIVCSPGTRVDDICKSHIRLLDYTAHPALKFAVAV